MLPIKTLVMTDLEREDFAKCDDAIEVLFVDCLNKYLEIGRIMKRILDLKLYRERYETFERYIEMRWRLSAKTFRLWATYADMSDRFKASAQEAPLLFSSQLENFNLSHAEILRRLPDNVQAEAWTAAVKIEDSPTAKVLDAVVDSFEEELTAAGGIENMTKAEELDFLQRAEAASDAAVTMARSIEAATECRRILAKACREIRNPRYGATFANTLALFEQADGLLETHETSGERLYEEAI